MAAKEEYDKNIVKTQLRNLKDIRKKLDDIATDSGQMYYANQAVNEAWNGDNSEAFLDNAKALRKHMRETKVKLSHVIEMLENENVIHVD